MNILKQKLELLNDGANDYLELLGEEAMDLVTGGIRCKMEYSGTYCGCGYTGPTGTPESFI